MVTLDVFASNLKLAPAYGVAFKFLTEDSVILSWFTWISRGTPGANVPIPTFPLDGKVFCANAFPLAKIADINKPNVIACIRICLLIALPL